MTPTPPHESEEVIFAGALALAAQDRAAYLDQACGSDGALRARVEELLRADESTGFMAAPAADLAATVPAAPRPEEAAGQTIGRYKLLQKIGEGGCGVVYMAEQQEPVVRRVALKVIKLGMDTREVVARFEAERQALALMDHPNIARVFDGGATETGRPFFVMELVRGVPITKYCDEQNLSTVARLELFTQVCHAVQHAHQKGIIHRDLKPSNILVTVNDGVAVPKVIDFGIAKATQGRLTDSTLFTAFEQFIGTPAYMSPEQAVMTSLDVDTRSDIYSLGVLLYELLTGRTPFDSKSLVAAGLDEIRRVIREVDPPRPSTRLSTLTDLDRATIAKQHGTVPAQLSILLRGDLDWIVMRCLEKDRTRRYETASALALDLLRHLHDEPVAACPPSTGYRVQKFARRHRLAFAATGGIAAAIIIGLAVATWSLVLEKGARERAVAAEAEQNRLRVQAEVARRAETEQRQQAQANEKKALLEAVRSEQAFAFLSRILRGLGSSAAIERDKTLLREFVDKTVARLDKELKDSPEIDGTVRGVLGAVYLDLGDFVKAEALAIASLDINRKVFGFQHEDVAGANVILSTVRLAQGRFIEATDLANEAVAVLQKLPRTKQRYISAAHLVLGASLCAQEKLDAAEVHLRTALALATNETNMDAKVERSARSLLVSTLQKQGRAIEAEPLIRGLSTRK
ncbi:MAG: serine/threonine-protein kinase [Opitutaceae bacterium]